MFKEIKRVSSMFQGDLDGMLNVPRRSRGFAQYSKEIKLTRRFVHLQGVQGEPLDRAVVVVSKAVVVPGEEVFAQGTITQTH